MIIFVEDDNTASSESVSFKTVLCDDIILTKESEYILLSINNKINLRLSKVNIDKLFDIFVKLISN